MPKASAANAEAVAHLIRMLGAGIRASTGSQLRNGNRRANTIPRALDIDSRRGTPQISGNGLWSGSPAEAVLPATPY